MGPVQWTSEDEAALQDLKRYLASPPILVAPKSDEPLLLYVAATTQVVSAVLVAEREGDPGTVEPAHAAGGCPAHADGPPSPGTEAAVATQPELPVVPVKRRLV